MKCALLLAALLAGCATRGGFETIMNNWVGRSESDLVAKYGPPNGLYIAPDGARILTFTKGGNVRIGGATTYQPVTSTTTGNIYGSNGGSATYRANTTSYQAVQQPTYNIAQSCTVNFKLVNDRIESWQADGNHCVG